MRSQYLFPFRDTWEHVNASITNPCPGRVAKGRWILRWSVPVCLVEPCAHTRQMGRIREASSSLNLACREWSLCHSSCCGLIWLNILCRCAWLPESRTKYDGYAGLSRLNERSVRHTWLEQSVHGCWAERLMANEVFVMTKCQRKSGQSVMLVKGFKVKLREDLSKLYSYS